MDIQVVSTLGIMSNDIMNTEVQMPFWDPCFKPLGWILYTEVGLLELLVILLLIFWGTFKLSSILHFHQPCTSLSISPCSHQHFLFSGFLYFSFFFFYNSHSVRCEVISHCGFDFNFPDDKWYWMLFHILVDHLCVCFGEKAIEIFYPFLKSGFWFYFLLLSCRSSLPSLATNPLQDRWFANIFSHFTGCVSILLVVSFVVKKLFDLM